jgi:predicted metal-dependent HD superfamily phosphohydrolase
MDRDRFLNMWKTRGGADAEGVFGRLDALYGETHRGYHHGGHIEDCLREYDRVPGRAVTVEMAIWFHDVIYDPRRKDNEEQSALHFTEEAAGAGMSGGWIAEVDRLIRVTAHHRAALPDEALLCDIDLSILGRSPEEYSRYVAGVRREYDWVSDADWRAGRAAVLRSFMERPAIYHTNEYTALETPARANMEAEISALSI